MSFTPKFQKFYDELQERIDRGESEESLKEFFAQECRAMGAYERLCNLYRIRSRRPVPGVRDRLIFFSPNKMQQLFWEAHTNRDLGLKMRQGGFTTFSCLIALDKALWEEGAHSAIMADTLPHVKEYFTITKRAFKCFQKDWGAFYKVTEEVDNVNALKIKETNSSLLVCTDARGLSLDFLHIAEASYIDTEKISDSIEAVPLSGWVILETTADGASGIFYDLWDIAEKAKGEGKPEDSLFKSHFFPWWIRYPEVEELELIRARIPKDIKYTDKEILLMKEHDLTVEHIMWRRLKLSESQGDEGEFNRKYPDDPMTCFLSGAHSVFPPDLLVSLWQKERTPSFIGDLLLS